jgi:TonB family protein
MVVMVLSLISLQLNIDAARDSALHGIKTGQWTRALEYARAVIKDTPEDFLLLGLFHYASIMDYVQDLEAVMERSIQKNKFRIIRAWEDLDGLYGNNINILNVLMTLHSQAYRTGAYEYAHKVLAVDSLNGRAHCILGHSSENDGNYTKAVTLYSKAVRLDTTLKEALGRIATIYLINNEYDSSLAYYGKAPYGNVFSNSEHIGEAVCHIALRNIEGAVGIIERLEGSETTWFVRKSLQSLTKYIDDYSTGGLDETDSIVILGPSIGERIPLGPIEWVAILKIDSVYLIVDPDIEKPEPTYTPAPKYPMLAREGRTIVLAEVDANGAVLNVETQSSSGDRDIDSAALECVRRWKFTPARVFGVPIIHQVAVPINFRLVR